MDFAMFLSWYVQWHYGRAFRDILTVGRNLMWFITHFFSIPLLLKTLFQPWKRIHETYTHRGLEDFFATLVVNLMTRVVGALVRLSIIFVGLAILCAGGVALLAFYVVWAGAPIVVPGMFLYGLGLLFI